MFISCDAKQLEWRTVVELSGDQTALTEILQGQDTHELNRQAFELPSRLIAKIYLFRTIFRGNGWSFANDPDFSHVSSDPKFWDAINEKFYKKYDGINKLHNEWRDLCALGNPICGPLGRQWSVPFLNKHNEINWTQFTNLPVQGTGADVMVIARVSLFKRLQKLDWPVKLVQTVHDSIVADTPFEYVQPMCNLYHQVFTDLIPNIKKVFGYDWKVPLECECYYGQNQAEHIAVTPTA